jgi:hypothetical protein
MSTPATVAAALPADTVDTRPWFRQVTRDQWRA